MNMSASMLATVLAAEAQAQAQRLQVWRPYPTGDGEARARQRDREQAQHQRELYAATPARPLTRQQRKALERQTKGSARGSTLEVSGDLTLQSAASSLPAEETEDAELLPQSRHKPDKGRKGGSCNRVDCQRPGATWFNSSTRAWYCPECAKKINYWSMHDDGALLCTPEWEL